MKRLTGFLAILFLITGCGAYQLDNAQTEIRTSFASNDYTKTAELIKSFEDQNVYKEKDQVLLNLEHGLVNHFAANYRESSNYFTQAEHQIEDLFTKSVSRAVQSFVVNDNSLAYDGEDYEDIYLNVFKGLNYIHLNDLDGALVEVRRVSYKLSQLNEKYNGLVESLSQRDTTSTDSDKWKTGKTNFTNSALGHYLSTILFAKTNKPDNARIEYENLMKAYEEQSSIYKFDRPSEEELQQLTRPDSYNVLVQAFAGRAPTKKQVDTRIYHEETDTYLKFSLPELEIYPTQVSSITIKIDGGQAIPLQLIEEMDEVAKEVYKVKEPIIYARTIVRVALKALAANRATKAAENQDAALGAVVNILGKVAQETSEKADLRSWQTMPGKAYAIVLDLPAGEHTVQVQYYNIAGMVIYQDQQSVNISSGQPLELIESIYWN